MCEVGSWRQMFCYWTEMLKSLPHTFGTSSGLIEGPCGGAGGKAKVRIMFGGIEPLSVVVFFASILVTVHFIPFLWYFIKFCFRAIKSADCDEVQECRQRRENIHEELHQDMSRQLLHQMDQDDFLEEDDGELMEEQLYQYHNMVDSSVQVQARNIPHRGASHTSLPNADVRQASYACAAMLRNNEYAWQRYDIPDHYSTSACLRDDGVSNCSWIRRRSPYSHQVQATPRLTRCPPPPTPPTAEAMTSEFFKDAPTQTTDKDFLQALQKCQIIRQTRSGAVYSVYF